MLHHGFADSLLFLIIVGAFAFTIFLFFVIQSVTTHSDSTQEQAVGNDEAANLVQSSADADSSETLPPDSQQNESEV